MLLHPAVLIWRLGRRSAHDVAPDRGLVTLPSLSAEELLVLREVGQRIRAGRTAIGMSIADLAAAASMNASFLGELERGRKNVSLLTLHRLAEVLRVRVATLVGTEPPS